MSLTYKESGVDIEKGDLFVERIKKMVGKTLNDRVASGVGGFAALYKMDDDRFLATGTDGVGTKLLIAKELGVYHTIGIDLVAMSVNDVLCTGAKPLFFLDYLACGKLDLEVHCKIVEGIVEGCLQAKTVLIGGETAEMPDLYAKGDFDLAGFCVGEVHKKDLIDGKNVETGDVILGLASSGFHSNGYSLLRKLIKKDEEELLAQLLTPTKIYEPVVRKVLKEYGSDIKGLANITGSGLHNIPRINEAFTYDLTFVPDFKDLPDIFKVVATRANLPNSELYTTWNMGIGMTAVVSSNRAIELLNFFKTNQINCWQLGTVKKEKPGVKLLGEYL